MEMITVERLIAEMVGEDIHPAEVCVVLETMLIQIWDPDVYAALSACRAIMCRLDGRTYIPAMPKWV